MELKRGRREKKRGTKICHGRDDVVGATAKKKGILFHEHFTKSRTVIQILAMEQKTDWQAPVTVLFWIILQLLSFRLMFPTSKTIAFPMNSPGSLGLCFLPALIEIIILLTIIKMEIPKHSKAILEGKCSFLTCDN
ncbi:Hypothetical predicted protein [Octopus vulgaris]|uniref:Uncharacterized protein n=1 Tax=Octopus vulgaris TaxID=6645 RepID=A0AA36BL82_OCTVU|nr:Hypothetical predicted protein [Octopus vulgaris]